MSGLTYSEFSHTLLSRARLNICEVLHSTSLQTERSFGQKGTRGTKETNLWQGLRGKSCTITDRQPNQLDRLNIDLQCRLAAEGSSFYVGRRRSHWKWEVRGVWGEKTFHYKPHAFCIRVLRLVWQCGLYLKIVQRLCHYTTASLSAT